MGALGRAPSWVKQLLEWYREHGRTWLPWRGRVSWYETLVAETLLVRTRVEAALRLYNTILEKYPTPRDMCDKSSATELEGLINSIGLPRRGKWLYETVCTIVYKYNGNLPCSFNELTRLPGIGRYLAKILLTKHCNQTHAFADTNVARVLSRLLCRKLETEEAETWLEENIPKHLLAEVSTALIDLGSTICRPRKPKCNTCPLKQWCCTANTRHLASF